MRMTRQMSVLLSFLLAFGLATTFLGSPADAGTRKPQPSNSAKPSPTAQPSNTAKPSPSTKPSATATKSSATATKKPSATSSKTVSRATSVASTWSPAPGPTFNNPVGQKWKRWVIFNKLMRTIEHAQRGSEIDVASWNILTKRGVTDLINAAKRGVRVRAIMDSINTKQINNRQFPRLRRGLAATNSGKPSNRRSYAILCSHACRGRHGQSHSKFFLFSHTGAAHDVVIEGGANLTTAAATNQWDEIYTLDGHTAIYNMYHQMFNQMWARKPVFPGYRSRSFMGGLYNEIFFPMSKIDPVLVRLRQVKCHGATGGYGSHGRTVVRASPDVIRGSRGMAIAKQLQKLYGQGCDVQMIYTVMSHDIYHQIHGVRTKRGYLPVRHLVQDKNGDGIFDNYFHIKVLTVNGKYANNPHTRFVLQGSSNWSGGATADDEQIGVFHLSGVTLQYQKWLSHWFAHTPRSARMAAWARMRPVDPYAHVDMD